MRFSLSLFASLMMSFFTVLSAGAVVYGDNDMDYIFDLSASEAKMSAPVAAMIETSSLNQLMISGTGESLRDRIWSAFAIPGGDSNGRRRLCPDIKFLDEIAIGTCSGVLIAPDKIATAAHCIAGENDQEYLKSYSWVFNYKDPLNISRTNIYRPIAIELRLQSHVRIYESYERKLANEERKKIGLSAMGPDQMDFTPYLDVAVVRLDRPVEGIIPATIDFSIQEPGNQLTMIGHPIGLPQKITRNGVLVENIGRSYSTTTLDTVKGNSGGPVFNAQTGHLVGLMVNQGIQYAFSMDRKDRCYRLISYDEQETDRKNLSGFMNISLIAPAL